MMVKKQKLGLLAVGALICGLLQACTQQDVYEMTQDNRRQACDKEPPSLQDSCRERYQQKYADYQREREDLLKDNK